MRTEEQSGIAIKNWESKVWCARASLCAFGANIFVEDRLCWACCRRQYCSFSLRVVVLRLGVTTTQLSTSNNSNFQHLLPAPSSKFQQQWEGALLSSQVCTYLLDYRCCHPNFSPELARSICIFSPFKQQQQQQQHTPSTVTPKLLQSLFNSILISTSLASNSVVSLPQTDTALTYCLRSVLHRSSL